MTLQHEIRRNGRMIFSSTDVHQAVGFMAESIEDHVMTTDCQGCGDPYQTEHGFYLATISISEPSPPVQIFRGLSPTATRVYLGRPSRVLLVFSYDTIVAFAIPSKEPEDDIGWTWTVSENIWSKTTGKHINQETPKDVQRTPHPEFTKRLSETLAFINQPSFDFPKESMEMIIESMEMIINYMWSAEQRDYENHKGDRTHIFTHLQRVQEWLHSHNRS